MLTQEGGQQKRATMVCNPVSDPGHMESNCTLGILRGLDEELCCSSPPVIVICYYLHPEIRRRLVVCLNSMRLASRTASLQCAQLMRLWPAVTTSCVVCLLSCLCSLVVCSFACSTCKGSVRVACCKSTLASDTTATRQAETSNLRARAAFCSPTLLENGAAVFYA